MPKPLVSVIIIFLNAANFLEEAIESVLAQTYKQLELLLVDDGSKDGSSEIARSYASRNPSRINYLEHEAHQNLGQSPSRNLGIRNAKGSYVAFLDADDYWLPEKLETHVKLLNSYLDAGMLFGSSKYWFSWTGHPEDYQRDYMPELRVRSQTLFTPPMLLTLFLEGKIEIPVPCSILVRAEAIRKIGGFDESMSGVYDDQAFYAKICLSTPVLATNDCLAWYRQHPKSNSANALQSGQTYALHYNFLKWLETYCHEKDVKDVKIWQAIHRQLWLFDNSSRENFFGLSQNSMRWVKKWILRVEEWLLPDSLRLWLWTKGLNQ